jgi:NAD(P)-dependent dehydrogenase (short-subunit alcohol dehydrogenase family)
MLEDKVVVVTGGGRGIGRAHSEAAAAAGAKVVINDVGAGLDGGEGGDRGPADEVVAAIEAAGGEAVAHYGDISEEAGARALIDTALDRFGRLDGVINNAGIVRDKMIFRMSADEWDAVVKVHLRGTFLVTRDACAHWHDRVKETGQREHAAIVNTSSTSGLLGVLGQSNYAAAKAGIAAFTQIVAMDMARDGVTCNALAPGARTRLATGAFPDLPKFEDRKVDPLAPESVAALGVFLLSEAAKDISGTVFGIQGPLLQLYEGWTQVNTLTSETGWSPQEIAERADELFDGRPKVYVPPEEPFRALVADAMGGDA